MTDPKSSPPQESAFHAQSIPLVQAKPAHQALFPYFLVALGTLIVVGLAGYWWINSTMKAELDAKKLDFVKAQIEKEHQIEKDKIRQDLELEKERVRREAEAELENERRTRQKAEHAQLAHLVESAQKQLDAFLAAQRERDELLASNGREIAARDELLTKYEIIERQHPAPVFEPSAVRELLTTVADRSKELAAQPGAASGPSPELKQSVDTAIAEANAALKSQNASNQALRALVAEAVADGVPAADVGIKEALELRVQRAEQARQTALAEAEELGRQKAEQQIREIAAREAEENTEIEVDAATRAFDQQQETIKRLHDQREAAQKAKDEELVRILNAQLEKEIAELRGQAGLAEAEVKVTEAAAEAKKSEKELEAERIAAETEKNRLREKARSRDVAIALAPFIGKGYWQPGRAQPDRDAAGMSLSAIKAQGGLDPSPRGMRELYHLGANPKNDRPGGWSQEDRMVGKPLEAWLKNKPGARDTARKAQDLLLELGDILVEVGLLSP
jgi:hypothetical protein